MIPWLLNLGNRMLACSLNMPEPLVHNTASSCSRHVQAVETSVGRTLCPVGCLRQLRFCCSPGAPAGALVPSPSTQPRKGELPDPAIPVSCARAILADAIFSGASAVRSRLAPARSHPCSTCPKRCCARPGWF